ncbi:Ufm1-specific protease [Trichostrongylus colubriformis]|uniref:Ufm1-specific protease n=1 Tax=Trichostrongylus colubriformis TaxID=6319 RepID=A0AAN8IPG3_TRICO
MSHRGAGDTPSSRPNEPQADPPNPEKENEMTGEDLFRIKSAVTSSAGASDTADQSVISLADSASNFDEHVGDEFDEVETVETSNGETADLQVFRFTLLKYPKNLPIPQCPDGIDHSSWTKAFEEASVYLIGTAHFSKESQEDVIKTIAITQPDLVMVELCPSRISILSMDEQTLLKEASDLNTQKILTTIKQSGVVQGILHVLLLSMSAHITRELSMAPGGEFRAAHKAVMQTQLCRLVLGDRPIHVTLQRALGSLNFWQKMKFFWHVALSHSASITPEEVEKCKQRDLLEQLLAEMAGDFPKLTKAGHSVMREKWTVNTDLVFQNYRNLRSWCDESSQFGGLVFGRPTRREVVLVVFAPAESLISSTVQFILSCMTADVELVGNVRVEGDDAPLIGDGFTLTTTREILDTADATTFLIQNDLLRHSTLVPDGLSVRTQVGFSCALREGLEIEDLQSGTEKFAAKLDQLSFANMEKGLLLRKEMSKEIVDKERRIFDDLSRGALQYKDYVELSAYRCLAFSNKDGSDDQQMVPIVRITRDGTKYKRVNASLNVTVPINFGDSPNELYNRLLEGLRRRVHAMMFVMSNALHCNQKDVAPTVSQLFLPAGWSSLLHIQCPLGNDVEQRSFRVKLHKLFNLPLTVPCLRPAQAITFAATKLLLSPHMHISNYKPRGVVSVVKGDYRYHHYMQDGMDDAGWGCAYRSLQSIWSWFILNGFTDKPVPTHTEIQRCLVEIGDKEEKFVGSRQWIGSTEIGFVLDHLLGIESRFIITNSGAEVAERARELALHFQTVGTPVMIGGGQLAHTILGVDFDENTGECGFLVLDPHYTGSEDLKTVLSKGWCGWKPPSFWNPEYFYNMVLPQPPKNTL